MTIQTVNLGTAPSGAGGDTFRSTGAKINENFTNPSHAASRYVGVNAGNVMEVGAFGLGGSGRGLGEISTLQQLKDAVQGKSQIIRAENSAVLQAYSPSLYLKTSDTNVVVSFGAIISNIKVVGWTDSATDFTTRYTLLNTANTQTDSNGFIKAASPIVKLFADKIELNDEAAQQKITFEKLGVGDYLVKGSTGFAKEGWYIETPKDANGNLLVAVVYEQLANGDISVKTYDYMLNKKGRIVADTETPLDIPETRWIDLRLQELPQPEIEMPESITPPDFQPTGLAQAVATVMEFYHDSEQ